MGRSSPTGPTTLRSRSPATGYWLHVLTEIKNRGVNDVLMVVCDGLTGPPDVVGAVWPQTITRTAWCICCATPSATPAASTSTAIAQALRPIYTAPTEAAASSPPPDA